MPIFQLQQGTGGVRGSSRQTFLTLLLSAVSRIEHVLATKVTPARQCLKLQRPSNQTAVVTQIEAVASAMARLICRGHS